MILHALTAISLLLNVYFIAAVLSQAAEPKPPPKCDDGCFEPHN